MTFRTADFQNSATLRSLQRLALEKGLIKPELKKEASAPVAQSSEIFGENLVSFCTQLRNQGFDKHADELELKYLMMKQAQTAQFYDITGEKGSDLVEFAHPDGNKKLDKDWDQLGEIETILDRQKQLREIVNKQPTGKLDPKTAAALIRVKVADTSDDTINSNATAIVELLGQIDTEVSQRGRLALRLPEYKYWLAMAKEMLSVRPMTTSDIETAGQLVGRVYFILEPGLTGGVTEDAWKRIKPLFLQMKPLVKAMKDASKKPLQEAGVAEGSAPTAPSTNTATQINALIAKLAALKSNPKATGNPKVMAWIDQELKALGTFLAEVISTPSPKDADKLAAHTKVIEEVIQKVGG
jgi:hypothetical protein